MLLNISIIADIYINMFNNIESTLKSQKIKNATKTPKY